MTWSSISLTKAKKWVVEYASQPKQKEHETWHLKDSLTIPKLGLHMRMLFTAITAFALYD